MILKPITVLDDCCALVIYRMVGGSGAGGNATRINGVFGRTRIGDPDGCGCLIHLIELLPRSKVNSGRLMHLGNECAVSISMN
jgi:hypothetical protein